MVDQLLYVEALLKFGFGLIIFALPTTSARLAGLPAPETVFFTRLLGLLLIGMAIAIAIEATGRGSHGLGPHGLAAINLVGVVGLGGQLWRDHGRLPRRAKIILASLALLLSALGLTELIVV